MLRGCAKQYKKDAAQNVQRIKKHRAPEKAADCLQYERMYESGICEVEPGLYSLTMAFTDVNFQLARQEEQNVIFAKYLGRGTPLYRKRRCRQRLADCGQGSCALS